MKEIKVGVIGCGSIAEIAHFSAIKKFPETKLSSVCDIDEKTAKETYTKWEAQSYYTDYNKMLSNADLDAVVIATPNVFHHEQALAVAKAG